MAEAEVGSVTVGIAGDHIKSINSRGVIGVRNPDNEITRGDVSRVVEAARAIALPSDREIIHVLPQEFTVDDQSGIHDPVGMVGVRLETEVHIITGASTPVLDDSENKIQLLHANGGELTMTANDITLKIGVVGFEFLAGVHVIVIVVRQAVVIEPGLHALGKILVAIHAGVLSFPQPRCHGRVIGRFQSFVKGGVNVDHSPQMNVVGKFMDQNALGRVRVTRIRKQIFLRT